MKKTIYLAITALALSTTVGRANDSMSPKLRPEYASPIAENMKEMFNQGTRPAAEDVMGWHLGTSIDDERCKYNKDCEVKPTIFMASSFSQGIFMPKSLKVAIIPIFDKGPEDPEMFTEALAWYHRFHDDADPITTVEKDEIVVEVNYGSVTNDWHIRKYGNGLIVKSVNHQPNELGVTYGYFTKEITPPDWR